jgi:hypothetical protein
MLIVKVQKNRLESYSQLSTSPLGSILLKTELGITHFKKIVIFKGQPTSVYTRIGSRKLFQV